MPRSTTVRVMAEARPARGGCGHRAPVVVCHLRKIIAACGMVSERADERYYRRSCCAIAGSPAHMYERQQDRQCRMLVRRFRSLVVANRQFRLRRQPTEPLTVVVDETLKFPLRQFELEQRK